MMMRLTQIILWAQLSRLAVCACLCVSFALVERLTSTHSSTHSSALKYLTLAPHLALTWGLWSARAGRERLADAVSALGLSPARWWAVMLWVWLISTPLSAHLHAHRAHLSQSLSAPPQVSALAHERVEPPQLYPCALGGREGVCFERVTLSGAPQVWWWAHGEGERVRLLSPQEVSDEMSDEVSGLQTPLNTAHLERDEPNQRSKGVLIKTLKLLTPLLTRLPLALLITLSLLWAPHVSLSALSLALYALSVLYEQAVSLLLGALNPLI